MSGARTATHSLPEQAPSFLRGVDGLTWSSSQNRTGSGLCKSRLVINPRGNATEPFGGYQETPEEVRMRAHSSKGLLLEWQLC